MIPIDPLVPLFSSTDDTSFKTACSDYPRLPNNRDEAFSVPGWRVTSHIFPAAYPRTRSNSAVKDSKAPDIPQEKQACIEMAKRMVNENKLAPRTDFKSPQSFKDQPQLYIVVNRYYRSDPNDFPDKDSFTVVLTHAMSMHKESWEPCLTSILQQNPPVREVWSIDSANHGDSNLVNRGISGISDDWHDGARDLLQFLLMYLPNANSQNVPVNLPPAVHNMDNLPTFSGGNVRGHRIFGIGHSSGGCSIGFAQTVYPELFSSTIIIDTHLPQISTDEHLKRHVFSTLRRRDEWPSEGEAKRFMLSKKLFYGRWDKQVLEKFVKYGLERDQSSSVVRLKMPKFYEAIAYAEDQWNGAIKKLTNRLAEKQDVINLTFIFADVGKSVNTEEEIKILLTQIDRVPYYRVKGAAHLMVQEKPQDLALVISKIMANNRRYHIRRHYGKL